MRTDEQIMEYKPVDVKCVHCGGQLAAKWNFAAFAPFTIKGFEPVSVIHANGERTCRPVREARAYDACDIRRDLEEQQRKAILSELHEQES